MPWTRSTLTRASCPTSAWGPWCWTPAATRPTPWSRPWSSWGEECEREKWRSVNSTLLSPELSWTATKLRSVLNIEYVPNHLVSKVLRRLHYLFVVIDVEEIDCLLCFLCKITKSSKEIFAPVRTCWRRESPSVSLLFPDTFWQRQDFPDPLYDFGGRKDNVAIIFPGEIWRGRREAGCDQQQQNDLLLPPRWALTACGGSYWCCLQWGLHHGGQHSKIIQGRLIFQNKIFLYSFLLKISLLYYHNDL